MTSLIEPLDIIRDDHLANIKVNGYHSVLNKEMMHINGGDIALSMAGQLLYTKTNRIMRRKRKKKGTTVIIIMEMPE